MRCYNLLFWLLWLRFSAVQLYIKGNEEKSGIMFTNALCGISGPPKIASSEYKVPESIPPFMCGPDSWSLFDVAHPTAFNHIPLLFSFRIFLFLIEIGKPSLSHLPSCFHFWEEVCWFTRRCARGKSKVCMTCKSYSCTTFLLTKYKSLF